MTTTGRQQGEATSWGEAQADRPHRLTGVRDTFLVQTRRSSGYTVGGFWRGRAPGFPWEQRWLVTKVRLRGDAVKVWGVQCPERDSAPSGGAVRSPG